MKLGTLYGVGAGPGATDLLTLRAVKTMERADVLALPRSSDYGESMAWRIVGPALGGEGCTKDRMLLTFPMSKDPERIKPYLARALDKIGHELTRGRSVAFVTEGDPSVFSTFIYVRREAARRWPDLDVQIVPGVTSITAVPAVADVPLADGQERIAVLPATYGTSDLVDVLQRFDTVVLMKLGGQIPRVLEALEATGLTTRAVFVSRATMGEQRIVRDVRLVSAEHGDCFAMIIVAKKERCGLLTGDAPLAEVL